MNNLSGKKVWITGASGGLGRAIAEESARRGADLILTARDERKLLQTKERCRQFGSGSILVRPFDLNETTDISSFAKAVLDESGGVDILVNNAGFGLFEKLEDTPDDMISSMISVNVIALMLMSKAVIPHMKSGSGHIVNIASQAGKLATPKSSVYSAAKHAVLGFSNSLRMEVAENNIFVTSVNPGPIETDFFDTADTTGRYAESVKRWMLSPQVVAVKTVDAFQTDKREINLPGWMNAVSKAYSLAPGMVERLGKKGFNQK
ncbi:SDR family NAD(P)-dependent oxidoreductase [Jeotgalibacillus haloalkalitolerans]|uniref:SDR family oxidoreductase n=1 Tax=Jeotgalibacillus haloalkalitolerans TaxID=3104292 RepID=A0ABU5KMZ2_9BACL|nr:SDR family oxidoreductase [Jeotgalibacillus sp. HH7-29]MDZ5712080.1 SDR family oxidoreductase [Jeotgalibacillus sp. HH7-29]